jgi:hypothetical protein
MPRRFRTQPGGIPDVSYHILRQSGPPSHRGRPVDILAREVAKEVVKQAVKQAAKETVKETVKQKPGPRGPGSR